MAAILVASAAWKALVAIAGVMLLGLALGQRSRLAEHVFVSQLFQRDGEPTRLRDVARPIDHVLCTTDLQSSEHVYFAPRFVYSYRHGHGSPGDLRLATALQCSAALPFAFSPRWLRTSRFKFSGGAGCGPKPIRRLVLTDGGVYDNMADQWPQGFTERVQHWPGMADLAEEPAELVVVNASAGLGCQRANWRMRVPWLGEISALLRVKNVLYDNTAALRRQALAGRFDRAELEQRGLRGVLVHIPQSPFTVPTAYQEAEHASRWPERAQRAADALDALGDTADQWRADAERAAGVGTNLAALGADTAALVLHHGYVLAMVNTHVILGYPLLDIPSRQRFVEMVT